MKMWWWNGEEVEPIPEELLDSPDFLQPVMPPSEQHGPFESYEARQMAAGDEDEDDDDEEDVYKNWRPPNKDTDFAAHAGQAEHKVLQQLNFNMILDGKEISVSGHGLDHKGFLTPKALRAVAVHGSYTDLWRRCGGVKTEAEKMLRSEGHSRAAREKVRLARNDLELSIFYRQLDVMAYRFQPRNTWAEKRAWLKHKQDLLALGKTVILAEHRRDCHDRERIRNGHTVDVARKKELVSACSSHLMQLDLRLEAMQELHTLLLCQVCRREVALALHCVSDVFDLLVRVRCVQVHLHW